MVVFVIAVASCGCPLLVVRCSLFVVRCVLFVDRCVFICCCFIVGVVCC